MRKHPMLEPPVWLIDREEPGDGISHRVLYNGKELSAVGGTESW